MEMRELRGDDLFTVLSILGKLNVKDDLVAAYEQNAKESNNKKLTDAEVEARGVRVMATVIQRVLLNISVVRDDINSLLADLTGKSTKEITELGIVEYTNLVIQLFKRPEFREVFTSAASLLTEEPAADATTQSTT